MKYPKLPFWLLAAALFTAAAVLFVTSWKAPARASDTVQASARYLLVDRGGRVAVCAAASDTASSFTSIRVSSLPSADQTALRGGIPAWDETALAMLLEDLGC